MMVTEISKGVKISVAPAYQEKFSKPGLDYYIFSYTVTFENLNAFPIQLISRKWEIFDSLGSDRIVEGEGVIGLQPKLSPGESHSYTSSCDLASEIGKMSGSYIFKNLDDDSMMEVDIPMFRLEVPLKLN